MEMTTLPLSESVIYFVAGTVGLAVFFIWLGLQQRTKKDIMAQRLKKATGGPVNWRALQLNRPIRERVLRPIARSTFAKLGTLTPGSNVDKVRKKLILAGNPGSLNALDFLGIKMLVGIVTSIVVFPLLLRRFPQISALLFAISAGILGLYLPEFWLSRRVKERQNAMRHALPDALDMLTICVDAGLGLDAAMIKVTQKWDNPLSDEFKTVLGEMRMGVRRSEALRHLVSRTAVEELSSFVAILVQAEKLGISVTKVLHTQSDQLRERRRQWAEEQAHKAPIKMMIPLVVFIFPATFAVILGPAIPRFMMAFGGH